MSKKFITDVVIAATEKSKYPSADREQFLKNCLTPPVPGTINVTESHAKNLGVTSGAHNVWLITRSDPQSVFFDEKSNLFGSCWGPDNNTGQYDDLGFRSSDPVEMYLL